MNFEIRKFLRMEGLWKSIKGFVQGPDPREITRKWRREIRKEKNSLNKVRIGLV